MNILFLTAADISEINSSALYKDLIRKFVREGHKMYVMSPEERRSGGHTRIIESGGATLLKVRTLNVKRSNVIEKGIGTILLEHQFYKALLKYFSDIKFDLVLYSTPPITFNKVIYRIKKKFGIPSYLMLKDIFPQNAVDLGLLKKGSFMYNHFRKKEKTLYEISDYIGCMSPANMKYVLENNPEVDASKLEICPNAIDIPANQVFSDKESIKKELEIPSEALLFVYGGNLGKPQGVDFLLSVLMANANKHDRYFLIIGRGTEYKKINNWIESSKVNNVKLLPFVPKEKYNYIVSAGDVGLVFLDKRFTIPNFPTRVMGYLLHRMPILFATDKVTDVGRIVEDNGCGYWVESGDLETFNDRIERLVSNKHQLSTMGEKAYQLLQKNYDVSVSYNAIMSHFRSER